MLLQIVFGGVSGEIWEVKLFILCFLSCFSVSLNSAFAFLYFRMFSVVMFLFRSFHFFILSTLNRLRLLFHHGTFWVFLIGCVWGIALWALERTILKYITLKVVKNMTVCMSLALILQRPTEMGLLSIFENPLLGQKDSDFDMAYLHGLVK